MKALTLWQPWASLCFVARNVDEDGMIRTSLADGHKTVVPFRYAAPRELERVKTIETRHWKAPAALIGQRIAIHAAVKQPASFLRVGEYRIKGFGRTGCALLGPGLPVFRSTPKLEGHILPMGRVLGTAVLADCVEMHDGFRTFEDGDDIGPGHRGQLVIDDGLWLYGTNSVEVVDVTDQAPYGLYEPGRWAWVLDDIQHFDEPIRAVGRQGIWNWEPPTTTCSEGSET